MHQIQSTAGVKSFQRGNKWLQRADPIKIADGAGVHMFGWCTDLKMFPRLSLVLIGCSDLCPANVNFKRVKGQDVVVLNPKSNHSMNFTFVLHYYVHFPGATLFPGADTGAQTKPCVIIGCHFLCFSLFVFYDWWVLSSTVTASLSQGNERLGGPHPLLVPWWLISGSFSSDCLGLLSSVW